MRLVWNSCQVLQHFFAPQCHCFWVNVRSRRSDWSQFSTWPQMSRTWHLLKANFSSMFSRFHSMYRRVPYAYTARVPAEFQLSSSSRWRTFCCSILASLPNCFVVLILTNSCQTDQPNYVAAPSPFHSPCWSNRPDELSCSQFDPFLVDHIFLHFSLFLF